MATFNELVTAWGFEIKPEALKAMNQAEGALTMLKETAEKIGGALTGGLSIDKYFGGFLSRSQDIINLSKTLGISAEALQKWQYAANASGVSVNSVMSDLETLRTQYRMTEKGVMRLADSFKKMSAGGAYFYGQMYGISSDTVNMLRQGSSAIKEMMNRAPVVSDEELKKSAELNRQLNEMKMRLQQNVDKILAQWVPAIEKLVEMFTKWSEKPGNIEKGLQAIKIALLAMAGATVVGKIAALLGVIKSLGIALAGLGGKNILAGATMLLPKITALEGAFASLGAAASTAGALMGKALGIAGAGFAAWEGGKFLGEKIFDWTHKDEPKGHLLTPEEAKSAWDRYNAAKSMPVPEQTPSAFTQAANASQTASGTTMNGTTINIITSQPISQIMDEIGNAVGGGPNAQPFTFGIVS